MSILVDFMSDVEIRYFVRSDEFSNALKGKKGFYLLIISLQDGFSFNLRKKRRSITKGLYLYIGSAMGGISSRLARYLKNPVNRHWHIDYLLKNASMERIIAVPSSEKLECKVVRFFADLIGWSSGVLGFGSSDCTCPSHLFLLPGTVIVDNLLKEALWKAIDYFPGEIYCLSFLG